MNKTAKPNSKAATAAEVFFRCLLVGLFFFFIFFIVPRLGQHCKSAVPGDLETLEDLQAFLLLLAEEHAHEADKAKHILSLAQQVGSSSGSKAAGTSASAGAGNVSAASLVGGQQLGTLAQQLQKSQADLAAAKKVISKHEEVLQKQLQNAAQLRSQLLQQQQHGPLAASSNSRAGSTAATVECQAGIMRALAVTGNSCGVLPGHELGGNVVVWGGEHKTATAGECCAACLAHGAAIARGVGSDSSKGAKPCNVWVHCSSAESCGSRHLECWLKHDSAAAQSAAAAVADAASGSSMWTSGVPAAGHAVAPWEVAHMGLSTGQLWGDPAVAWTAVTAPVLLWSTALGAIHVHLLPELAPGSVRELLRMGVLLAATRSGQCSNCRIYRAERGFLVQGVVEAPGAYVAVPRHPNPPQRRVMQRGLMCWAGGGGGPDWFVNMIDQSGFGDQHLCFGQVDEAGLAVFERILSLPVKPKGGARSVEMVLLQQDVRFNFTVLSTTAAAPGL